MTKIQSTALTASGDTTKTLVDTLTVPAGVSKIVGVASYGAVAAAMTTAESVSGIIELESDDFSIIPLQFPTGVVNVLTNGAIGYEPKFIPVDIPVTAGHRIKVYVTHDMAETGAVKTRAFLMYE